MLHPTALSSATPRCTMPRPCALLYPVQRPAVPSGAVRSILCNAPLHSAALCGALWRPAACSNASCRVLPRPAAPCRVVLLRPAASCRTLCDNLYNAPRCAMLRVHPNPLAFTTLTAPLCHLRRPLQRAVAPCCALQHPAAPCSALRRPAAPCNALLAALFASCLSLLTASLLAASLLAASLLAAPLLAAPLLAAPLVGCPSSGCSSVGCPSSGCSSVGCLSSGCSSASLTYSIISDSLSDSLSLTL